ncbi:MAG: alkaline phosphatase family protein [Planctomycetota bacterium]|nr:alkaline phosphatase family protein [Planctomycetota bacterium]
MQRVALLDIVALGRNHIGAHTPAIRDFAERSGGVRILAPAFPAVTTTVQTSMLTGRPVREHGIVSNGWYDRGEGEVKFWKQSQRLVESEPVWREARRRDDRFTCANVCCWYAMNSDVDVFVTPRPIYRANGRKLPDCLTRPAELRDLLQRRHGVFPLFRFWGPGAGIESTRWITEAAIEVADRYRPTLQMVYLPHLDYPLQKLGPDHPEIERHLRELDHEAGRLIEHLEGQGVRVLIASEYSIEAVERPVALNRVLREHGYLELREERGSEMLVPSESRALAVADHQVAHVYVNRGSEVDAVRALLQQVPGVERIVPPDELGLGHHRAGDLVAIAEHGSWFVHDWWSSEDRAPDYSRTVDIHRKPGYDPRELFATSRLRAAWKVALMKLGIRTTLDIVPLDASLVRGSHGRTDSRTGREPVLLGVDEPDRGDAIPCEAVRSILLEMMFG